MKNTAIYSIFTLFLLTSSFAEISIGPKIGLGTTTLDNTWPSSLKFGLEVGALINFNLNKIFGIKLGPHFQLSFGSVKKDIWDNYYDEPLVTYATTLIFMGNPYYFFCTGMLKLGFGMGIGVIGRSEDRIDSMTGVNTYNVSASAFCYEPFVFFEIDKGKKTRLGADLGYIIGKDPRIKYDFDPTEECDYREVDKQMIFNGINLGVTINFIIKK